MPVFDSISSNIAVVLSINPSANVFVFGDFNACHKDWLTFSGRIDRPGKLCYNFSIPKNLTQIVNFPTLIHDCDSHSPALLDSFLSSDISICSTMAFPPLGNSDHVVVPVSIDFPINLKLDALFHGIIYDYSDAYCLCLLFFKITGEMFYGKISLNSVFLLLLVNFVNGFRLKLMYI